MSSDDFKAPASEVAKELLLRAEGMLRSDGQSNEADAIWRAWQAVCGITPVDAVPGETVAILQISTEGDGASSARWHMQAAGYALPIGKHNLYLAASVASRADMEPAPVEVSRLAEDAKRLMIDYCQVVLNCSERATDQNVKAVAHAESATYAAIDRLATMATTPASGVAAIDMVLFCPACGTQHIDAPEEEEYEDLSGQLRMKFDWTNPPHRSHLCHACEHVWRPADIPTNGVAAVKTIGKDDSPISSPATDASEVPAQQPDLCPYCDGSGESTARSGDGPDAWDEPCICPRCKGAQTLQAAYDTLAEELPALQLKVAQLGIYHSHATQYGWAPNQTDGMQSFAKLAGQWLAENAAPEVPAARQESAEAIRLAALEQAARACEKLAEQRFDDHGTREPDTGACYYGGRVEEEYQTRDEEDDECAKTIRALAAAQAAPVAKGEQS